jgi:hypothetical protein
MHFCLMTVCSVYQLIPLPRSFAIFRRHHKSALYPPCSDAPSAAWTRPFQGQSAGQSSEAAAESATNWWAWGSKTKHTTPPTAINVFNKGPISLSRFLFNLNTPVSVHTRLSTFYIGTSLSSFLSSIRITL